MTALPTISKPGRWVDAAACARTDPELFFPGKGEPGKTAKKICGGCPVQQQCAEYAIAAPYALQGIWGGLGERQRADLRRLRGICTLNNYDNCGTPAGAKRHWRAGEKPCNACRRADAKRRSH